MLSLWEMVCIAAALTLCMFAAHLLALFVFCDFFGLLARPGQEDGPAAGGTGGAGGGDEKKTGAPPGRAISVPYHPIDVVG